MLPLPLAPEESFSPFISWILSGEVIPFSGKSGYNKGIFVRYSKVSSRIPHPNGFQDNERQKQQ
jgi:hypothetical protein